MSNQQPHRIRSPLRGLLNGELCRWLLMNMNKKKLILLGLCMATQLYLGRCVVLSRWAMERHWCETLGGRFEPTSRYGQLVTATSKLPLLPTETALALRFGVLIPVLSLVAVIAASLFWRKSEHEQRLVTALLVITLVSLSLTAGYCYGIGRPPLTITYRLGP